ncbi:GL15167 [Drosophila persimilis]|uniref:aralkylamine N-acetyltransferase n=2 Tax=pseudoobscura subgroup TaxID=32358 RepID=Q29JC4_DROPS|nr:dopamine N-acetyltransferase [Drosophila pseudoobscura]XP_002025477.1 dopamine N-acetyltransferase [Drosophila persimilis]EDW30999.1 GL15167 [Drosophila persimilis]
MNFSEDIQVRVVESDEGEALMQFLLEHYYREEPLTAGCSPPEPEQADKDFLLSNIPHGTCLVVVQGGSRIVGALVAGPKDAHEAEHLAEEVVEHSGTKWGRILGLLARVERETNVCKRYGVPSTIHVHALGIDPRLRGLGLGARLMSAVAERARALGHPLVTVDCTSLYSAGLMARLGYELINTIRYDEYLDEFGQQVFRPPAPHDSVKTYVLRL